MCNSQNDSVNFDQPGHSWCYLLFCVCLFLLFEVSLFVSHLVPEFESLSNHETTSDIQPAELCICQGYNNFESEMQLPFCFMYPHWGF